MSNATYKAEINYKNKKITFEGPKEFVEAMVVKYAAASDGQDKAADKRYRSNINNDVDARDLVAAIRPRGHHETVAVLAFALTEAGRPEFTENDIRKAYIRAGVRPPKVVGQALRDAKNKFDLVDGTGRRGLYRLSSHGDRVVRFDLPR